MHEMTSTPTPSSLGIKKPKKRLPTLSDIEFEELTQKLADKQVTLIDVRLPNEHVEVGTIPDSRNVPCEFRGIEFEWLLHVPATPLLFCYCYCSCLIFLF